ncbi:MAG: hypothetical protein AAGH15_23835 [Myxococcota bacterium]
MTRFAFALALASLGLAGCASPIVGAECAQGFDECSGACVDLTSDDDNCGGCGFSCGFGGHCVSGRCLGDGGMPIDFGLDADLPDLGLDGGDPDGGVPDGGDPDGGDPDGGVPDGGVPDGGDPDGGDPDGGVPDGGVPDGGVPDGGVPDGGDPDGGDPDMGDPDMGMGCMCDVGETCCGGVTCTNVDVDPLNCGGCGIECTGGLVCSLGSCRAVCAEPTTLCGGLCVDTSNDPDNCGGCAVRCASGLCSMGACTATTPGHVVLIGHSYRTSRIGMNRLLGNTVFIPAGATVEVLAYEGDAAGAVVRGADAAIDQVAMERGRMWTKTVAATAADIPALLVASDVFLLYSQTRATDLELQMLGVDLRTALRTFVNRGGVVAVTDGDGAHAGTWQVLDEALLLEATSRTNVSLATLAVVAPADTIANLVPLAYRGESDTVYFSTAAGTVVVEHPSGPVAIHTIFTP